MDNKQKNNKTKSTTSKKNSVLILASAGILVGVIIVFAAIGIYNLSKIVNVQKKQESDIELWNAMKYNYENLDEDNSSNEINDSDISEDNAQQGLDPDILKAESKQKTEIKIGGDIAGVIKYQNDTIIPFYKKGSDVDKGATIFSDVVPGEEGRTVILGHRDQSFYDLKYLEKNDVIKFEVVGAEYKYKVIAIDVVEPDDIPLSETDYSNITLITCYPFRFIGSAPQRYVVQLKKVG